MRAASLPIVLISALAITACGVEREQQAVTVARTTEPSAHATEEQSAAAAIEPQPSAPAEPKSAAGRSLTEEQLRAALPTVQDFPSGWSQEQVDETEDESQDDVVTPPECQAVFDAMASDDVEPAAEVTAEFAQGPLGPFLTVGISSHESDVDPSHLDSAVEALGSCPQFTVTDSESTVDFNVSPLSFSNPGDRTLALRLDAETEDLELVVDQVLVIVGANVVSLASAGFETIDAATLEALAQTTVAKLAEVE